MAYKGQRDVPGWIYTLHLHTPFKHAQHYRGWTDNPDQRLKQHFEGHAASSPLLRAAREAGIGFVLAEIIPGTRHDERRLKNRGGASRTCPICRGDDPRIEYPIDMLDAA